MSAKNVRSSSSKSVANAGKSSRLNVYGCSFSPARFAASTSGLLRSGGIRREDQLLVARPECFRVAGDACEPFGGEQRRIFRLLADELHELQPAAEIFAHSPQLVCIEALHVSRRSSIAIAVCGERGEQPAGEIDAVLVMPTRVLDLRIDSDGPAHRFVEARDQRELLIERRDSEQRGVGRESRGEPRQSTAGIAPLRHCELLELREIEIDHVVATVRSLPTRESARDVGDVVEM